MKYHIALIVNLIRAIQTKKMTQLNSKALLAEKSELTAQLNAARLYFAGEDDNPDVAQNVFTLREQQHQIQAQVSQLSAQLNRLNGEIPALAAGKQAQLLDAISAQRWYALKNIPEVLYDSLTGLLWPSFYYGFELLPEPDYKQPFIFEYAGLGKWKRPQATDRGFDIVNEMRKSYPAAKN
jgi:hypothetical protein